MKTRLALAAAALAVGLAAPLAFAGPIFEYPVYISGRFMRGSIATAHNSSDTVQYIGCDVSAYADGGAIVSCYGRTAGGTPSGCSTSVPAHIQAIAAINSDSVLEMTWDSSSRCDYLTVRNISWFVRK